MSEQLTGEGTPKLSSSAPVSAGFPAWGDWFVLLLVLLLSALAGGLIARWCGCAMPVITGGETIYPETWSFTVLVLYLGQMVPMLALTLIYRRLRRGPRVVARFSAKGLNPLLLLWGIVAMAAFSVVLEPLLRLLDFDSMPLPDPGRGGWALVTAVVAAPLFEELLCRGIVLESLRVRAGVWAAWLGSALFFGAIHLQPLQAANAFVLGLIFGYLCLRTRSLWPSLLLHAFNNALALLLMWSEFPGERFGGRPMADLTLREMVGSERLYLAIYAVSLLIALLSVVGMVRGIGRLRAGERKKEGGGEINSIKDTLISGK